MTPQQKDRSALLKLRNSRRLALKELCAAFPDGLDCAPLEDGPAEHLLSKIRASVRCSELKNVSDWRPGFFQFLSGREKIVLAEFMDWEGSRGLVELSAADAASWVDQLHEIYRGCVIAIDVAANQAFVTDMDCSGPDGKVELASNLYELEHD